MKQITLKFLRFHCLDRHHCAVQYYHLIDGIIKRFEEANPHIKIESTVMRNWYQLMHMVNKKLPADDETPDIFHTCGGDTLGRLAEAGLVHDLTQDLDNGWREDFVAPALYPLKFNGGEFAVPLEQGCLFVWYNKKIFQKFGFSVPHTFDDLLVMCRELSRSGLVSFTVGNREKWPGAFFFCHLFHRIGGEKVFVSDFTKASNYADIRECFIQAAEKLIDLVDAGAFSEDCDVMDYQQQRLMFVQGKAAMQLNGNRLLNYLKVEGPGIIDQVGIFPFPLVNDSKGKASTIFGGSLATYAISARSRHKKEAIAFLKALTDKLAARHVIYDMGDIPALKHISYNDYPYPLQGKMAEELSRKEKVLVHYFKYLSPHPAGVYLNLVSRLFTKEISSIKAFKSLEEALINTPANNIKLSKGLPR